MNTKSKYLAIISSFINGEIDTLKFEELFLKSFKNEEDYLNNEVYQILNKLFINLDSFCGDSKIANYDKNNPFRNIDENELRKYAVEAYIKLKNI